MSIELTQIQSLLNERAIDGWLLYDFQGNNPLARALLGIAPEKHLTRRFFYWIPREGEPTQLVHRIEPDALDHLPGKRQFFLSGQELTQHLMTLLNGRRKVAMEYSPLCALPYLSKVDAGTVDLIRSFGVEVISSAPLLQRFSGRWSEKQWQMHLEASVYTNQTVEGAWNLIRQGRPFTEYTLQQWILEQFDRGGFETNWSPICAVNAHSADPHFSPSEKEALPIQKGDFLLIDLGCKRKKPHAVYADYTRVAAVGVPPSSKQKAIFEIVKHARDAALGLIRERMAQGKPVKGSEVDRACRAVIEKAGYGPHFLHRTGHHIDEEVHGPGAHLDSLETVDERELLPSTCFSIEPGIYLKGEFGVRLECDVYISPVCEVIVTGMLQTEIKVI